MQKIENEKTGIAVKSSLEMAMASEKRPNKLYGNFTPAKGAAITHIVNAEVATMAKAMSRTRCSYDDLGQLKERTAEYFADCAESQLIPTMESWAVALGVSRKTLYKWFGLMTNEEVHDFLEQTRSIISSINSQAAFQGAINPVTWIFYAKNRFEMSDKTEITLSAAENNLGAQTSPEELQRKYIDATAFDSE